LVTLLSHRPLTTCVVLASFANVPQGVTALPRSPDLQTTNTTHLRFRVEPQTAWHCRHGNAIQRQAATTPIRQCIIGPCVCFGRSKLRWHSRRLAGRLALSSSGPLWLVSPGTSRCRLRATRVPRLAAAPGPGGPRWLDLR